PNEGPRCWPRESGWYRGSLRRPVPEIGKYVSLWSESVRESRSESQLPRAGGPADGAMEGGRRRSEVARPARGPAAVRLLRGPAHRQRQARHPPHPGARVQRPVRPLQDDARLLRRAESRLGHARPAGRDRGREEAQDLGQVPDRKRDRGRAVQRAVPPERLRVRRGLVAFSQRMGFWLDYDNAYWTLTSEYIQSVWWALSEMWKQNLVYKGFRVAPYCSRCATPLSSHELSLGYRDNVPDPSVYIRFRLKNDPKTSILAWTTTPWTLPGNVALAVDNDIDYIKVKEGDEYLILAEARLTVLQEPPQVVERMKGSDLVGLDYEPLYPYSVPEEGRAQYVV